MLFSCTLHFLYFTSQIKGILWSLDVRNTISTRRFNLSYFKYVWQSDFVLALKTERVNGYYSTSLVACCGNIAAPALKIYCFRNCEITVFKFDAM